MVLLTLAVLLLIERIVIAHRQRQKAKQVNAMLSLASADFEEMPPNALRFKERTLQQGCPPYVKNFEPAIIVNNEVTPV